MLNFQYFDDTDEDPNQEPDHEQTEANNESEVRDDMIIEDELEDTHLILHWGLVTGNLNNIVYNPDNLEVGINSDIMETMSGCYPIDFYHLFFDDDVLDFLVIETNSYA